MSAVTLALFSDDDEMTLREYCEQTSLHGWFYIFSADKKLWKTLWSLVSERMGWEGPGRPFCPGNQKQRALGAFLK